MLEGLPHLGRMIKQTQYRNHLALERRLLGIGTTLAQWDALRAISMLPGVSAHALAVATFQSDQAFGVLAGRLIAQGLIERRAGRGRCTQHQLTPAGVQILAAGQKIADDVLEQMFGGLSAQEQATLVTLLERAGQAHAAEQSA